MAKTKWKKIIVAGPLVKECIYPAINGREEQRARDAKRKLSSEAQRRMNQKYSYQKLELMLAANFVQGDLVCSLTYDDAHLPRDRKEAMSKLKYFRAKLAAARKADGEQLIMFWNVEHKHGEGRWHHHVILNATGKDYELIRELWGQGEVEIKPLRVDKEKNYESLARYMCKEQGDKVGGRAWSYTRNAKKPEVETFRVEADTPLQIPKGAIALEESSEKTNYGKYQFIKYLGGDVPQRVLAKRRKNPRK